MELSMRVRTLRLILGLTQEELAAKADISRVTMWQIEARNLLPSVELEDRLRAVLHWTPQVDALLDDLGAALSERQHVASEQVGAPQAADR